MEKIKFSIIICTYNGEKFIENCLNSVLSQKFKNFEIICVDGGSSDKTKEIINKCSKKDKRIKFITNKKKFPEGMGCGKWLGYKKARGEIIGFIDQDNIIQRDDLFNLVHKEFNKEKKVLGILGAMKHDLNDKGVVRYVSLAGTDSFLAYRSIDFLRNVENFAKVEYDSEDLEKIALKTDNLSITGGNCFFYRKKDLELVGGYSQDILVVDELVKKGFDKLIIIKNSTKHYAESSIFNLIKKKFKWGKRYQNLEERFDYFPKTKTELFAFIQNLIFCSIIIPNFLYSFILYKKSKDLVSFMFPIIAFFNILAYEITYLFRK